MKKAAEAVIRKSSMEQITSHSVPTRRATPLSGQDWILMQDELVPKMFILQYFFVSSSPDLLTGNRQHILRKTVIFRVVRE